MPTRPGIIIPAVLFASWADKGLALVVMGPIISYDDPLCQNVSIPSSSHGVTSVI
jgi:hypothetical protein